MIEVPLYSHVDSMGVQYKSDYRGTFFITLKPRVEKYKSI